MKKMLRKISKHRPKITIQRVKKIMREKVNA